jgi:hypothetical protein
MTDSMATPPEMGPRVRVVAAILGAGTFALLALALSAAFGWAQGALASVIVGGALVGAALGALLGPAVIEFLVAAD